MQNRIDLWNRPRAMTAAIVLLLPAAVMAADARWVTRDGKKIDMHRSRTELGVLFKRGTDVDGSVRRMAPRSMGQWEAFINHPDCRLKILQIEESNGLTRSTVRLADPTIEDVRPIYRFGRSDVPVVTTGTIVARVRPGFRVEQRDEIWADHAVRVLEPVFGQPLTYRLAPLDSDADELEIAERLAGDSRVVWAQPNLRHRIEPRQAGVTDPFFSFQWHLHNTGQLGGDADADIDAVEAWTSAEGQDVIFGMFDDACDVDHEDLRDAYLGEGHDASLQSGQEGADDPSPKRPFDRHGTAVMGLAVARANNRGGRGVAYQSRFTASRGLSDATDDAGVASAFTFARQQNVDVHINSWGFSGDVPDPQIIVDAIQFAFETGRNKGNTDPSDEEDDPLGMVIVFATGNSGTENVPGFELSALPYVIAVGAANDADERSSYSNYGESIDVLAPSNDGPFNAGIFSTDNRDTSSSPDQGYNVGGQDEFGFPEPDPTGNYTGGFGGTSAACPIAAGVAGLVLSANPLLTASDVRLVLAHTADPIDPTAAEFDGVTQFSTTYGYGRINAAAAVEAAIFSRDNTGQTWPASPGDVRVASNQLRWKQNSGTQEFLVLESDSPFEFVPEDTRCYSASQLGCSSATLATLPSGVSVRATGCALQCSGDAPTECEPNSENCVDWVASGTKYLAIFARNGLGRYSFGVAADSTGDVRGEAELIAGVASGGSGGGGGGGSLPTTGPAVTIAAAPLEGTSPLTVRFTGNALSSKAIDDSRTAWDFDVNDGVIVDSTSRNAQRTYTVPEGVTRTFIAQLTMYDVDGNPGSERVSIQVRGGTNGGGDTSTSNLRIVVGTPDSPAANVSEGTSPFQALLSIDATSLSGTLRSVSWDLGDGTQSNSLTVPHTYTNTSDEDLRIAVSATVTTVTSGGTTLSTSATKLITIHPGEEDGGGGDTPTLPGAGVGGGGSTSACGIISTITLVLMVFGLGLMRMGFGRGRMRRR